MATQDQTTFGIKHQAVLGVGGTISLKKNQFLTKWVNLYE
jgi:hypothetical protein